MSDYSAIVENIRAYLASDVQIRSDEVVMWAEQYARLCRDANERLRQCNDYLKQGLRAEAIHCADSPPNLLDMMAVLDMTELPEWKQACFRFELPDAPGLSLDTATTLNEAYAYEQPLEGLMAYHRLLALARAPIKNRLTIMRRLAEKDTTTAIWDEDIRLMERLRLEELRGEVPAAARRGDKAAIDGFRGELGATWMISVPPDFKKMADDVAGKLLRASADAELRKLMPALNNAYSAMNQDEARTLLANFLIVAAQAQMHVPADLQEQIDPIHNWLTDHHARQEQEAAFQQACDALQQAIDTSAPTPRLERTYRESLAFHMELDPQLEGRYRRTLIERAAAIRNKRIMIFSGIAAGVLLLGGVATVITWQTLRAHEVRDTDAVLRQAIDDASAGSVARADAVVKQVMEQHPRIASDATIIRTLAEFKAAATAEQKRQDSFHRSMATATAAGIDKPDNDAIHSAESIAKTADEQQAVTDLKSQIADHIRDRQVNLDAQFTTEASAITAEANSRLTPALMASQPANYAKEIDAFTERATELGRRPEVSAGLRMSQSKSLLAILKQKRLTLDESMTDKLLLDQVEQATTADAQERAIKAYLEKATDSPYAADFRRAAQLVPAERAIEAWGALTQRWDGKLAPATYQIATTRVAELQKYLTDNPTSPLTKPIGEYVVFLNNGLQAAAPDGPWKKTYHDLLLNPLVHDLGTLQTTDGKRYYVLGDPHIDSHKLGDRINSQDFQAITTSDISKKDTIKLHDPIFVKSAAPAESPQATYAKAAITRIEALDLAGWETAGTRTLRQLVAAKDMDPVIKAILVQNALRLNQPLSDWAGDTACKRVMDGLAAQNVDDVEWLNPDNPPRPALISALNQLFGQLPSMDTFDATVRDRRDHLLNAIPTELSVSGILLKENDAWQPQIQVKSPLGTVAFAVGETGNLVPVARRDAKGWAVDASRVAEVPAGSLLFLASAGQISAQPATPINPAPRPATPSRASVTPAPSVRPAPAPSPAKKTDSVFDDPSK